MRAHLHNFFIVECLMMNGCQCQTLYFTFTYQCLDSDHVVPLRPQDCKVVSSEREQDCVWECGWISILSGFMYMLLHPEWHSAVKKLKTSLTTHMPLHWHKCSGTFNNGNSQKWTTIMEWTNCLTSIHSVHVYPW